MGNTRARKRTKVLSTAIILTGVALTGAACSEHQEDKYALELQRRGFENVALAEGYRNNDVYYGSVGQCWFRILRSDKEGWSLTDRSSKGEDMDVTVYEPTAAKIRQIDAFDYCSNLPSTAATAPQGTSDSTNESSAPTP